jgi:two-component system, NarL family, response regulator LiaR
MPEQEAIRVLIVDDHMMVREGLKILLSTQADLEVVGEAEGGAQAVVICERTRPDVVLMDVVMPGMDGATATARLLESCPEARVIALTSFVERDLVERTLDAGAISYLLKDARPEKLANAIREAARGKGTIDSSAMNAVRTGNRDERTDWHLTPREEEVLALLSDGLSNKEIAVRLTLSSGTVRLHVSNILAKMGANNRTAAAMMALKYRR